MADFNETRVRNLLARHELPDAKPHLAAHQGDVNDTYLVGAFVVRLARIEKDEALEDWRTEVFAHPYVHRHGVRTPCLIAWGEHYTIVERIEGCNMDADAPMSFFRSLGAQLARLHALPFPDDPTGALDDHTDPASINLAYLAEPLRPLGERLAPYTALTGETFIHGDVMPGNVLVGPHDEAVLIDWGDAGRGHPAYDLCAIPLVGLWATLEAYTAAGGPMDADSLRRLTARRLEIAAYHASVGDQSWTDELLVHFSLLNRLAG